MLLSSIILLERLIFRSSFRISEKRFKIFLIFSSFSANCSRLVCFAYMLLIIIIIILSTNIGNALS